MSQKRCMKEHFGSVHKGKKPCKKKRFDFLMFQTFMMKKNSEHKTDFEKTNKTFHQYMKKKIFFRQITTLGSEMFAQGSLFME